jgi:drug/metabolite transporter (DMT)-like permease
VQQAMPMTDNLRAILLMVAAMAAFTVNDACMKALSDDLPLYQTIFIRGIPTSIGLGLIAAWRGELAFRFSAPDSRMSILRCVAEVAATVAFQLALGHMPLANLSAIMQCLPLAVTLAAALVLGDRIGTRRVTAILVGFAGVLLIVRPGTDGFDRWALVGLASVAFVVVRDLSTRAISARVPSTMVAFLAALSVTLCAGLAAVSDRWVTPGGQSLLLIVIASTCLLAGYLTVVMTMRTGEMAVIAPFRYSGLVVAIFLGWACFGDFPDALTLIGSGIVVATGIYTFHRERIARKVVTAIPEQAV